MKPQSAAAKPYARALWQLAKERNETETVARELGSVVETLAREPGLPEFLERPWVSASAQRTVALEVASRLGLSALTRDFLGLVAHHRRADHLEAIAEVYRELVDDDLGRARARVRTAVPLSAAEQDELRQRLGRALGGKHVVLDEVVDQRLLGGFVAEVGSYVVDGSLDGQLGRLKDRLARG